MYLHTTNEVLMIEPVKFFKNEETAVNNLYQKASNEKEEEIQRKALQEFRNLVDTIRAEGTVVNVIKDTIKPSTPDSIFPNNWFSTHEGGKVFFYSLFASNRRSEVVKYQKTVLEITGKGLTPLTVIDYTDYASQNIFLEGTGSMVLDRKNKMAYCCMASRSDEALFLKFCSDAIYHPVLFNAFQDGHSIYHTNVLMGVGEKHAIIALSAISDINERKIVKANLEKGGNQIIDISMEQVKSFLGNTIELKDGNGCNYTVMSQTAYDALTKSQKSKILNNTRIVKSDISTIEHHGGGSARCMIAEIFR